MKIEAQEPTVSQEPTNAYYSPMGNIYLRDNDGNWVHFSLVANTLWRARNTPNNSLRPVPKGTKITITI